MRDLLNLVQDLQMFKLCLKIQWLPWIFEQIEFEYLLMKQGK